jgi:hypothetical protein
MEVVVAAVVEMRARKKNFSDEFLGTVGRQTMKILALER